MPSKTVAKFAKIDYKEITPAFIFNVGIILSMSDVHDKSRCCFPKP